MTVENKIIGCGKKHVYKIIKLIQTCSAFLTLLIMVTYIQEPVHLLKHLSFSYN